MSRSIIAITGDSVRLVAIPHMDATMKMASEHSLIPKIEEMLSETGFQVVKRYGVEPRMDLLNIHTAMHILAFEEAGYSSPEESETKEKNSKLVAEVKAEASRGVGYGAGQVVLVARRNG